MTMQEQSITVDTLTQEPIKHLGRAPERVKQPPHQQALVSFPWVPVNSVTDFLK